MTNKVTDRNRDEVPTEKKLDDLYKLIDGIEVAMMTTRRSDGQLVSRAMQTQERRGQADLWFVTDIESNKFEELAHDPQVNVSYYKDRTREWVSVSGTAILSRDRNLIHAFYKPGWKIWFPEEDEQRDGGPSDPRIALIMLEATSVHYSRKDRPGIVALFELARARVTGKPPKLADMRELGENELQP